MTSSVTWATPSEASMSVAANTVNGPSPFGVPPSPAPVTAVTGALKSGFEAATSTRVCAEAGTNVRTASGATVAGRGGAEGCSCFVVDRGVSRRLIGSCAVHELPLARIALGRLEELRCSIHR